MPHHIRAKRNGAYGPPNVTSKYAPLEDITFSDTDVSFCNNLVMRRWAVLNSCGFLPQSLTLVLPSWTTAVASEKKKDQKPPLVVISSNRSHWIKKGLDSGDLQLQTLELEAGEFDSASDLRALDFTDINEERQRSKPPQPPLPSPPMYHPKRIGKTSEQRNVYVVVHTREYKTYKDTLEGTGITVVGWMFTPPQPDEPLLCGFGASRYAAIEFCKELRRRADNRWDYAWLFDDNVVAFTSFAGYEKVEAAMASGPVDPATGAPRPYMCAGFSGGTATVSSGENADWARRELKAGEEDGIRGKEYARLPTSSGKGLVQQAALWNIAELQRRKLNFGPIFVASGEDVSLGNYFDAKNERGTAETKMPYLYYEGIGIVKEDATIDASEG